MSRPHEAPFADTEIFEAYRAVAHDVAEVFSDSTRTEQRMTTLGNYMLLCAIGTPDTEVESYDFVFQGGLILAGMSARSAQQLHHLARRSDVVRYVYSLSYVPESSDVPGIVRRPKSVTLRETAFVRGILAARTT